MNFFLMTAVISSLVVVSDDRVVLRHPNLFSLRFQQAKQAGVQKAMARAQKVMDDSQASSKVVLRHKSTLKKLAKAAKKLFPVGKTLFLNTLQVGCTFVSEPCLKALDGITTLPILQRA